MRTCGVRTSNGLVSLLDLEDHTGLAHDKTTTWVGRPSRLLDNVHAGLRQRSCMDRRWGVPRTRESRPPYPRWDAATGANTLANSSSSIHSSHMDIVTMFVSPAGLTPLGRELLFVPNETETSATDFHEGSVVTKLRGMGPAVCLLWAQGGRERHQ